MITYKEYINRDQKGKLAAISKIRQLMPDKYLFHGLPKNSYELPTLIDIDSGIAFKLVFGGSFQMGCSKAEELAARKIEPEPSISFCEMRPVKTVKVSPFLMSIRPLLIGEYLWAGFSMDPTDKTWPGAPVFLQRIESMDAVRSLGCRLSTEAELEYACRANGQSLFAWGDSLPDDAVLESYLDIHYSGHQSHSSNRFGFLGMYSAQWCADIWKPSHNDNKEEVDTNVFVIKGGGAMFWPWQGSGEWVWCMSSMRMPSSSLYEDLKAAVRLVRNVGYDH